MTCYLDICTLCRYQEKRKSSMRPSFSNLAVLSFVTTFFIVGNKCDELELQPSSPHGTSVPVCFALLDKPLTFEGRQITKIDRISCEDLGKFKHTKRFDSLDDYSYTALVGDECLMEGWRCDDNAHCINNGTSFECKCNDGYTGTGFKCEANGCLTEGLVCDNNSHCVNNGSSFFCFCHTGTGYTCTEQSVKTNLSLLSPNMTVCPGLPPSSPVQWGQSNYCFVTEEISWDMAFSECTLAGGHLVVLGSSEENEFLRSETAERGTGSNWVGLKSDIEGWAWIDKSETYLNWGIGEGNPGVGACARMKDDTGTLHDKRCTSAYAYICEEEII